MKTPILSLTLGFLALTSHAAAPIVSNVVATQRPGTKLVDITYSVNDADGDPLMVGVEISGDGGVTYAIPSSAVSGHVGAGVTNGNRAIVWNAGANWDGAYVPNGKVRVTAFDNSTTAPPVGFSYIPGGIFQMGDNLDSTADALPVHTSNVNGFFMERYEASGALWGGVQAWGLTHSYTDLPAGANYGAAHPVQTISWYAVVKWCNARSEKDGLTPVYYTDDAQTTVYRTGSLDLTNAKVKWTANGYRLPTEAEWEKAARGGSTGLRYPWGNTIDGSQANYSGSGDPFGNSTSPVGYYNGSQVPAGVNMANGYGLYDMAGNVFEWCWDRYGAGYSNNQNENDNPRGPDIGTSRLLRGGAWFGSTVFLRCASRDPYGPTDSNNFIGFRCARGL